MNLIKKYNDEIMDIVKNNRNCYSQMLTRKKSLSYLLDYIMEFTSDFPDIPFATRVYFTLNNIHSYVKCEICGKDIPHNRNYCDPLNGYPTLNCSRECAQKNPKTKERNRLTCLEKYGCEHAQQSEKSRKKMRDTLSSKSKEEKIKTNEKRMKTCLEKYGCEYVSQNKDISNKMRETALSKSKEFWDKRNELSKHTKLERYGNENYFNRDKMNETISNRTDEERKLSNEKRKATFLERYGVDCALKNNEFKHAANNKKLTNYYNSVLVNYEYAKPLFTAEEFVMMTDRSKLKWKCTKCGHEFESDTYVHLPFMVRCEKCHPYILCSELESEREIVKFIKSLYNGVVETRYKKLIPPYEVDIYIPEFKLAIEYDGIYWHSDLKKTDNNYHLMKTEMCEKQGIQLIHIFENEWKYKNDIVKSRLKNIIGIYENTVYARKCTVKEIDDCSDFMNSNHIQGNANASVKLGLFHNNELISVMTFCKSRFDKKHEWEMLRYCNKLGYHVPGGASKLLTYFERNYKPLSIVTYADRRWSMGKVYESIGFSKLWNSKPDYWYFRHDKNSLESRLKFQKHKLEKILDKYDSNKSEYENMIDNGYMRIYDCGNIVFEKIFVR